VQSGDRKPPGYGLPAYRRQQTQHHGREQGSLDPKAPPVPTSHSPDGFSITTVVQ